MPPLQPVNDVAVVPVHVTVPDEPNEIVFAPELNLSVAATEIVALGKVTAALSVVARRGGTVRRQGDRDRRRRVIGESRPAVELPAELVERDPCILLSVRAPCLVGLRLHRGREELRDPDKDDSDDREHDEHLRKREAVLRFRGSPGMQPRAPERDTCSRRRALAASGDAEIVVQAQRVSVGRPPPPRARPPSPLPRSPGRACSLSARPSAIMKSCRLGAAAAAVSSSTSPLTTRSINAFVSVCISKNAPSAIASGMNSGLFSRISSWMRLFVTITSTAATRPPSARGRSRCEMTPLQHAGQDRAHLRLLDRREELDQAAERLGRVDRVHRREHEVAGLRGLQRRLGGLGVAKLADQDHVRVLAQRAPERLVERVGVDPDLALVDDAGRVVVQDLDRVLDRDDVLPARAVDVADHRGERGRLPGAGGAGDEDQPAVLLGRASRRPAAGAGS